MTALQQSSICLSPLDCIASTFARVASTAEHLKIAAVIRPAAKYSEDMVDLQPRGFLSTSRAASALQSVDLMDIFQSVKTTVLGLMQSIKPGVVSGFSAAIFQICGLPRSQCGFNTLRVLGGPPLNLGTMFRRVPCTSASCALRHIVRMLIVPFFGSPNRALNADAISDKPFVGMTVNAWFAARIMARARGAGCYAVWMVRRFGLALDGIFDRALRAKPVGGVSLHNMTVTARLAGKVESLASGPCRFTFGYWSHGFRAPASDTLIVMQMA